MSSSPSRTDRIFPLRDAAFYPGNDFADMVFFFPAEEGASYRMWLLTEAEAPVVQINEVRFEPVSQIAGASRWWGFGAGHEFFERFCRPRPFSQLKVFGLTPGQAAKSYLVVTGREDLELSGTIEDAERLLWGMTRVQAGTTRIHPSTVTVGEPATFRLEYRPGDIGLPAGALLRINVPRAFDAPQTEDPQAPGWIGIVESDAPVELVSIDTSVESHRSRDVIYRLPGGLPAGGRVELIYRTDFTYIYPCAFDELDLRYWYSLLSALAPAVSFDGTRALVPPPEGACHVVCHEAGRTERLFLFMPGRRLETEHLKLVGLATDRYRNVPTGPAPMPWRLTLEGPETIDLETPEGRLVRAYRFEMPLPKLRPGVWRVRAIDVNSGETVSLSNPLEILPEGSDRPRIYWGEIHGHCEASDGCGEFSEMFRHAREEGRLDFAASADHACYFSDNEWLRMQDITNGFNRNGEFVTLIGYEWAGNQGHRNVYTSGDRLDLFRGMSRPTDELNLVYDHFAGREDVVAGPHTGHTGDFWKHHNPDVERFIEIYSMWGVFEELVWEHLNKGATVGVTGGGDCHTGHCGLSPEDAARDGTAAHGLSGAIFHKCGMTAATMDALTRRDLVAALRRRRTYATTTARILLDFSVSGIPMGAVGEAEEADVLADVHACDEIEKIEIIRGGEIVHAEKGTGLDHSLRWKDADPPTAQSWYMLKVIQRDGEQAWSSPVWITAVEAPSRKGARPLF